MSILMRPYRLKSFAQQRLASFGHAWQCRLTITLAAKHLLGMSDKAFNI
ncbi:MULTISPECIES: hypothetical protein [Pseudomonas]|nr:hypothetical protein [Pseudomonas mosselii]